MKEKSHAWNLPESPPRACERPSQAQGGLCLALKVVWGGEERGEEGAAGLIQPGTWLAWLLCPFLGICAQAQSLTRLHIPQTQAASPKNQTVSRDPGVGQCDLPCSPRHQNISEPLVGGGGSSAGHSDPLLCQRANSWALERSPSPAPSLSPGSPTSSPTGGHLLLAAVPAPLWGQLQPLTSEKEGAVHGAQTHRQDDPRWPRPA